MKSKNKKMKFLNLIFLLFLFQTGLMGQTGENLFDDSQLHEIQLTMVESSIFINSKDYQMVNMVFDGEEVDSVGFKKKGNISASHPNEKFPFKIKTNKYVNGKEYDEIKEFTLHNNYEDPSMMREKMTYDLMNDLGLHSLRTAFAKLYINGEYWGLYTIVEGKDEMYKHVFDNRDGAVLESIEFGDMCYQGMSQDDYSDPLFGEFYILDNGDEALAWEKFPPMLDAANNTSASEYMNIVPDFLNVTDFFKYQAANVYLLNFDSYIAFRGNQLYYFNEAIEIWEIIPWDFNASFGLWNTNNYRPFDYPLLPTAITNGCIASNINLVPELEDIYMETICNLVNNLADTTRLNSLVDQWRNQIEEAVYQDTRKDFTNSRFDEATEYGYFSHASEEFVPAMKTFITDRWEHINQELNNAGINCSDLTSIDEVRNKFEVTLYPNPTNGLINYSMQGGNGLSDNIESVEVYNSIGQVLYFQRQHLQNDGTLDMSSYKSGVYYLKILFKEGTYLTKKIIKI